MASSPLPLTDVGLGYSIFTQVVPTTTVSAATEQNSSQTPSPLQKFLKGEPKALGVVQIMIGLLMILFGIVIALPVQTPTMSTGVLFLGSLIHISAGCLAVSASNKVNACVVKATLVLNIFSMIAAGITIIMLSLDLVFGFNYSCYYDYSYYGYSNGCRYEYTEVSLANGITGVLLVFSLLQFAVSIVVSAFTCKATCTDQPTLNIINVVPNPVSAVPVVSLIPAYQSQPGVSTMDAVAKSSPSMESSESYYEKPDNCG